MTSRAFGDFDSDSVLAPVAWFYKEDGADGGAIELTLDLPGEDLAMSDALIFNVRETGYYRVNYNEENWFRIIQALREDVDSIHRYKQ